MLKNILLGLLSLSLLSCNQDNNKAPGNSPNNTDTTQKKEVEKPVEQFKTQTYKALPMKGNDSVYKYVKETFKGDELKVILQLNRVDERFLKRIDTIIIPENISTNLMDYAPFPSELEILKEVNKMVIFSYPIQAFGVYEKGKLIKWGGSSMGKKASKTPTGLHFANWKGRKVTSTVNSSWILEYNFNIMNKFGVGWHQYELPGYPASHSCLRLFMDDAKWLYDFADQWILSNGELAAKGTPTLVYGDYPWGEPRPWFALAHDGKANNISVETLNAELQPLIEEILKEQKNRAAIEVSKPQETQKSETSDSSTEAKIVP